VRNLVLGVICWQCGAAAEGAFCGSCQSLQPPGSDYFRAFGLDERLSVDPTDLQSRYYSLTRRLHPDRFARRDPREQRYALEASSILNDGYRVLRDPVERAEYVLARHGLGGAGQRAGPPPELLEEVFELNLAIEELRSGDQSARPALEEARHNFDSMLAAADSQIDTLFAAWDRSHAEADLSRIRGVLDRRKYIQNLVRDVGRALQ
jgi:molecular chaperone HscB